MNVIKAPEEIEKMKIAAALLARCLDMLVICSQPGCSSKEIDVIAEEFIRDHHAIPAFKNYGSSKNPFPASICFSILLYASYMAEQELYPRLTIKIM